jgi:hypothetical protein
MSKKEKSKKPQNTRLNLDEITPAELFNKMRKLNNDALKEAGESISGGTKGSSSVLHSSGPTFSKNIGEPT